MRSPALAIAWEFRQRHRSALDRARQLRAGLRGRPAPDPRARAAPQAGSPEWHCRRGDRAPFDGVHVLPRGVQLRPGRRPGRTPIALSRPHVHAAGDDPGTRGLAHALRHRGRGEPVAGHGALRPVVVGTRAAPDLAGAAGRGVPRLDAGADVDGVRPAGAAHRRHRAVAGGARRRRHPGGSARSSRAPAGRHAGAAASPRVSRRLLRRGASAPWRRARLAGSVRPDLPDRACPVASAGPVSFADPRSSCGSSGGSRAGSCRRSSASCCRSSWACSTSPATSRPCSSSSRSWACCSPLPSWPASRPRPQASRVAMGAIPPA